MKQEGKFHKDLYVEDSDNLQEDDSEPDEQIDSSRMLKDKKKPK